MTRGWLPQRAGLPGLNGGGAAAAVPPFANRYVTDKFRRILNAAARLVSSTGNTTAVSDPFYAMTCTGLMLLRVFGISLASQQGWNCRGTLIFEWKSALNFNPWAKFQTFRHLTPQFLYVNCKWPLLVRPSPSAGVTVWNSLSGGLLTLWRPLLLPYGYEHLEHLLFTMNGRQKTKQIVQCTT